THDYNTRQYEAMKKALESDAVSKMDVIQTESAMKESEAAIRNAAAVLENAKTMLGYCTIRAPFAGHVSSPPLMDGDFVAGEASPVKLTTLYDDSGVSVYLSVEDSQFLRMKDTPQGKAVDYNHIPVLFGDSIVNTYTAKLVYEAPAVNKATGTIDLRLSVDNPAGELRPGMYATVMLPYAIDPKAIVIKDAAISTDQLGKYVYVVNDSNKIVYTPIKAGELYQDTLRIVSEGLSPTDRYVTKALLKVRDGMTVNPVVQK
ncbi:MAG: efflux RND transporter periplasmic adaptor subunit, partial [Muribaculaceae bacterium]|nr:efflux RND transporter periplasmic adaptor subunit [Muribaculaceae bacterium]